MNDSGKTTEPLCEVNHAADPIAYLHNLVNEMRNSGGNGIDFYDYIANEPYGTVITITSNTAKDLYHGDVLLAPGQQTLLCFLDKLFTVAEAKRCFLIMAQMLAVIEQVQQGGVR